MEYTEKFFKKQNKAFKKKYNGIVKYMNDIEVTKKKIVKLEAKKHLNNLDEYKLTKLKDRIELDNHVIEYYKTLDAKEANVKKSLAKEKQKRNTILYGNITTALIMICFPLALYGFFNGFYSLVDATMASLIKSAAQSSGAINVSNVAVINQVKSMIAAFGAGLAGGGSVLVARYYGAGKIEDARRSASNMFLLTMIVSILILCVLMPLTSPILQLAQVPEISADVIMYFELVLVELIFVSINTIFIGLEKVKGNSKKILWLNILVLMIKLALNCIFIFGFHVDKIIFLELATIGGQATLTVISLIIMFGRKNMLQITFRFMKPMKIYIIPILKLSIPIFLGKFVMSLGKTVINSMCGAFYGDVTENLITGALGVSNNLSGLVTTTTSVFEEGESTIVSQNIGNRNLKRTTKAFIRTLIVVSILSTIGFILVRFIFLDQLTMLFSSNGNSNMQMYIKEIFVYDCWSIPALGLTSALLGLLYGYGKTFLSGIINFSRIGIRIVTLLICYGVGMDYHAAGVSMGISNVLIGIMALIFLIIFLISLKAKGYKDMKLSDPEPEYVPVDYN